MPPRATTNRCVNHTRTSAEQQLFGTYLCNRCARTALLAVLRAGEEEDRQAEAPRPEPLPGTEGVRLRRFQDPPGEGVVVGGEVDPHRLAHARAAVQHLLTDPRPELDPAPWEQEAGSPLTVPSDEPEPGS